MHNEMDLIKTCLSSMIVSPNRDFCAPEKIRYPLTMKKYADRLNATTRYFVAKKSIRQMVEFKRLVLDKT